MAGGQLPEVRVQDEARAVAATPRFPGGDDQDAHPHEPTLAVVIATRDRPHLLAGLLDALPSSLDDRCEVVVVDSASTSDATAQLCAARGVRCVREDRAGTSRARNRGIAVTSAPLIAFTDDDCRPAAGWAQALRQGFADPDVGLVTGRVEADRESAAPVSLALHAHAQALAPDALLGHGANCALRRAALEQVGGFDERLGPGTPAHAAEDQDLFARVLRAGWVGCYEPGASVVHLQWRTRGQGLRRAFAYGVGAGTTSGLRDAAWRDAVLPAARDLQAGYLTGTASGLLRAAGALVGRVRR